MRWRARKVTQWFVTVLVVATGAFATPVVHAQQSAPHPIDRAAADATDLRGAVEQAERRLRRRGATMLSSGGASLAAGSFFMTIAPMMMPRDTNGFGSPDNNVPGFIRRGRSADYAARTMFIIGGALLSTAPGFFQAGATRRSQARRLAAALEEDDENLQAAILHAGAIDARRGTRKFRAGVALSAIGGTLGVVATTMALTEHFGDAYRSDAYTSAYAWMAIAGGGILTFGGPAYAIVGSRQRNAGNWLQRRTGATQSFAVLPAPGGLQASVSWTF